jgi:hypothetical protein
MGVVQTVTEFRLVRLSGGGFWPPIQHPDAGFPFRLAAQANLSATGKRPCQESVSMIQA